MTDRTFDRIESRDDRSRDYPIRTLLPAKPHRSYTWRCSVALDQGSEGACVGFGWAHELAARPREHPVDAQLARSIYRDAQLVDEWPGEAYSGSSVLAGAKIVRSRGYMSEYRWAFGLDDVLGALSYAGPVVLGLSWHEGMRRVDSDGYVRRTGAKIGGHCIVARGISVRTQSVLLHNSWGASWGRQACARISFDDLGALLADGGDACIPVDRK